MKKKAGRAVACAGVRVSAPPQRRLTVLLPRRRAAMRNKFLLMFLLMAMSGQAAAWDDSLTADSTFSIIARDVAAGELGMAVQSKAHAVGSRTISARGGLAVIAHQAVSNPMYGQIGLELLQRGYSPQQALDFMLRSDEGRDSRQVARAPLPKRRLPLRPGRLDGGIGRGGPRTWTRDEKERFKSFAPRNAGVPCESRT